MSQTGALTRLAVRELWITFRMLAILAAFVAGGATVALLPAPPVPTFERLAIGLAAATAVSSAIAAWSFADERTSGRAGWLVTRSVSRTSHVTVWFVAIVGIATVALAGAATLGWMSVATLPGLDAVGYVVVTAAIGCDVAAAVALGLLAGALLRPRLAAVASLAVCGAVAAAAVLVPLPAAAVAHPLLPRFGATTVVADGLAAAGIGLTVAAVLLALTRVAMARAEL